ncbi:NADH-ubiquinone oxidoreductasesubunit F [Penicillium lividum]|nr:NADH-ubiquinone oxidoreductasesubunit F [Penicillium lividum]
MTGWVIASFWEGGKEAPGRKQGKNSTNDASMQLISSIKASGLRGRGGGGFPTGLKYESWD